MGDICDFENQDLLDRTQSGRFENIRGPERLHSSAGVNFDILGFVRHRKHRLHDIVKGRFWYSQLFEADAEQKTC